MENELESVVLVPASGAGQLVRELRMEHDPSAVAGIPPHVTLMFPFLPPSHLTAPKIEALEKLIKQAKPFDFALTRVSEFVQGVIYLVPEPAAPFVALTREIGRQFGLLPFGGQFGQEPIAHLTVGIQASPSVRKKIAGKLSPVLPIPLRAVEAWLLTGSNEVGWETIRRMPFAADPD